MNTMRKEKGRKRTTRWCDAEPKHALEFRNSLTGLPQEGLRDLRVGTRFSPVVLLTLLGLMLIQLTSGQITGPTLCPSDSCFTVGYSDLRTLREDIILNSEITGGAEGGFYILCPATVFNFTDTVPPADDDLVVDDDDVGQVEDTIDTIVITANNTALQCGNDGSRQDDCVLLQGDFHILIEGAPTNVTVTGLTFRRRRGGRWCRRGWCL